MTPHRQLPEKPAALLPDLASDEMERLALKTLLMGRYEMESAVAALHPDAFYHPKNRAVYDAVLSIVKRGERPDLMKVTEEMQTPEMRKAGVLPEELSGLFVFDSSEDLTYLIRRLEDLRQRRELQLLAQRLMNACLSSTSTRTMFSAYNTSFSRICHPDIGDGTSRLPKWHIYAS